MRYRRKFEANQYLGRNLNEVDYWIAKRESAFFVGEFKGVLILGTINSYHRVTLSCEIPEGSWHVADGRKAGVLDDDKFHEEYEVSRWRRLSMMFWCSGLPRRRL